MKQLFFVKKRVLEWRDVPEPKLQMETDAIVAPVAAARCDLDNAFLHRDMTPALRVGLALHLIDPLVKTTLGVPAFAGPFPYGHECVARVVETGPSVRHVALGDLVVVPFQVSCGTCPSCALKLTAHCETDRTTPIKAFGFGKATGDIGGMVADLVRVPFADHMLVKVPNGIEPAHVASASDNIADGWRTVVGPLERRPGAPVLVVGGRAKSVALYAVAAAKALGASRVDYIDSSRERLKIAERLGANAVELRGKFAALSGSTQLLREGYPISVDGSGLAGGLPFAIRALSSGGTCTTVAFYLRAGTPIPLWRMYVHGSTLATGLANVRVDLPMLLEAVSAGRLRPELVTTLTAPWSDAADALLDFGTKVVLTRN